MSKVTAYTALSAPASNDVLPIVDVSDTTQASSGTTKKIAVSDLTSGTAQIAGDLGGTAASPQVTGTHLAAPLPIAQGGSGQVTAQAALDALAAAVTANRVLAGNGTHVTLRQMTPADLAQPWQFLVTSYGAKGDGKVITDATVAAGALTTLTSASAGFTSADTGKAIVVSKAGGSAATPLITTITFVSATTVTLASPASAGGVTNVGAIYGTDDTSSIQSCVNAAVTYAQGQAAQFAEVIFPPSYYMVAGSPVKGATLGNAQITLPVISPASGCKVNLKLTGMADVTAAPEHWLQVTQAAPGSVLVCANASGSYDGLNGPSCMIGGPVNGYGGSNGTYSNMHLTVEGLTCLLPYTTTIGGMNLYGLGQAWIKSFSVMPMAVVPAGTPWPQLASGGPASNEYPSGLITPATGNNARNDIDYYTCYGQHIGFSGCDQLNWKAIRTIFCNIGWLPSALTGSSAHSAAGLKWCCETTANPVLVATGSTWGGYDFLGYANVNIAALGLESFSSGLVVSGDSSGFLGGVIWFESLSDSGGSNQPYHPALADHLSVKLCSLETVPGPVTSPQAAPSSNAAWLNGYYRDAWITLSATTITAVKIGSTAQNGLAGSPATYSFLLPSGHSYTPTYTGALTHTVTLL